MQSYQTAKIHAQKNANFVQFYFDMHSACAYNYSYAQFITFFVHITPNIHSACASESFDVTNCDIKNSLRFKFGTLKEENNSLRYQNGTSNNESLRSQFVTSLNL